MDGDRQTDRQTATLNYEISTMWETELTTTPQKTSGLLMRPGQVTNPKTLQLYYYYYYYYYYYHHHHHHTPSDKVRCRHSNSTVRVSSSLFIIPPTTQTNTVCKLGAAVSDSLSTGSECAVA